jgi:methylated-DNA-[protein]-cysteine S-methyltransferase
VTSISAVPGFAVQAMAGVQCLLAGVNSQSEQGWAQPCAEAAAAGVLGDMRQAFAQESGDGLPDLQEIALDEFAVPAFHSRVYAFTRAGAGPDQHLWRSCRSAGRAGAARAVGQALGANPFAPIVPCHGCWPLGGRRAGFRAVRAL